MRGDPVSVHGQLNAAHGDFVTACAAHGSLMVPAGLPRQPRSRRQLPSHMEPPGSKQGDRPCPCLHLHTYMYSSKRAVLPHETPMRIADETLVFTRHPRGNRHALVGDPTSLFHQIIQPYGAEMIGIPMSCYQAPGRSTQGPKSQKAPWRESDVSVESTRPP